MDALYIRMIKYYYVWLRMQYGKLRTNTDCHEWCLVASVANPASSPWMCDLGIRPFCCMNNLYISHRSLYVQTYSFWTIDSMLIKLFRVTSWFDTVCNIVIRWMKFRENRLHEHELQLSDCNVKKYFDPNICISGIIYIFFSFWPWKVHEQKL